MTLSLDSDWCFRRLLLIGEQWRTGGFPQQTVRQFHMEFQVEVPRQTGELPRGSGEHKSSPWVNFFPVISWLSLCLLCWILVAWNKDVYDTFSVVFRLSCQKAFTSCGKFTPQVCNALNTQSQTLWKGEKMPPKLFEPLGVWGCHKWQGANAGDTRSQQNSCKSVINFFVYSRPQGQQRHKNIRRKLGPMANFFVRQFAVEVRQFAVEVRRGSS